LIEPGAIALRSVPTDAAAERAVEVEQRAAVAGLPLTTRALIRAEPAKARRIDVVGAVRPSAGWVERRGELVEDAASQARPSCEIVGSPTSTGTGVSTLVRGVREPTTTIVC
jgi:hypothetical protein